jgi:hypothetical protein
MFKHWKWHEDLRFFLMIPFILVAEIYREQKEKRRNKNK